MEELGIAIEPGKYGVRIARSDVLELPRHPDAPTGESWLSWTRRQQRPLAVDLFCGAGGLSLGLEDAGYRVVLAVDRDERSIETHRANFSGHAVSLDLSDPDRVDDMLDLLAGVDIDLVAGGPPCQPFSRAGRSKIRHLVAGGVREAEDGRRDLWQVFLRVVEEIRPRAVLMENVPDMALGDDCTTVRQMARRLGVAGYEVEMGLVDAWRYGVPQHRQRLILVALREGDFEWPKPLQEATVRDAIGDLPKLGASVGGRELAYDGPHGAFQEKARGGVPAGRSAVIFDHMTRAVRADDRAAFQLMGQGLRYVDLPEALRRYRADIFDDRYNRLAWNDRSRSITAHIAKDGYWYIHPAEHRTLTVREAARLQTFPDHFRFSGSRSHAFAQIGNAVPPALAREIAAAILAGVARPAPAPDLRASHRRERFRNDLLSWTASRPMPPWLRAGEPWPVLIGMICGGARGERGLAERIVAEWGSPETVNAPTSRRLRRELVTDRGRLAMTRTAAAAKVLRRSGWEAVEQWTEAAGLGPAGRQWVLAIGLGAEHVVTSTATLRVAARFTGTDVDSERRGSNGRLVLAQLIGGGPDAHLVTGAIAALATEVCVPGPPRCGECPVAAGCLTASTAART